MIFFFLMILPSGTVGSSFFSDCVEKENTSLKRQEWSVQLLTGLYADRLCPCVVLLPERLLVSSVIHLTAPTSVPGTSTSVFFSNENSTSLCKRRKIIWYSFYCRHTTFYREFKCLFNTIWYVSNKRYCIKGHEIGEKKLVWCNAMLLACFSAMTAEL